MRIIDKIDDSFGLGKKFIYVIEIETNVFLDVVQVIDDDCRYFFYVLDESAYKRDDSNEIVMLSGYAFDDNRLYEFINASTKLNMEKLVRYLENDMILEFNSDEECMDYFNTYDYQNFKTIEEMKKYQDRYGFNIGAKRYHINYDEALDVWNGNQ